MEAVKAGNCTKTQAELAQQASSYVLERMDRRITIREIADHMHVSQTQLKNSFRNYYGNSVYKYIRSKKMEQAAALQPDMTRVHSQMAEFYYKRDEYAKSDSDAYCYTNGNTDTDSHTYTES